MGGVPPGKAVLSMNGLSYGAIRADTEEKLSVLTVQDVGQVMPGGTMNEIMGNPLHWVLYLNRFHSSFY